MPATDLKNHLFLFITLGIFLLIGLILAYLFFKERQDRKKPYFKFKESAVNIALSELPKPLYSVALIGDIGAITDATHDPVMQLTQTWMDRQGDSGAVVLLGDNIYPIGLPPENSLRFPAAEQKLVTQINFFKPYQGRVIYLSGNHDWHKGRKDGYSYLLRQQDFVRQYLDKPDCYLPLNGCPGPVSLELAPGLRLIVINTQWWVQRGIRPIGKTYDCDIETIDQFYEKLTHLLHQHQHEQIIVAAHHPLYSKALHGGNFTMQQHLFPLTEAHKKFYVPLPIAGSLYPVYRKLFGAYEDMSHPRYRRMRKKLLRIFKQFNNIVYVAGHDHNLQYFNVKGNHFLVSGSGSKTAFVKKGGRSEFTHEQKGFFILDYYPGNEVWLRAIEPTIAGVQKEVIFQKRIK